MTNATTLCAQIPLAVLILLAGCATDSPDASVVDFTTGGVEAALESITSSAIETHITVLAHDSLEGRAPGTRGFDGASRYVESIMTGLHLRPAGVNGTFKQPVPLQESLVDESASSLSITSARRTMRFSYATDFYLSPHPIENDIRVSAPVAFVGYGVSAPALDYDDYGTIDVTGKIVAYLTGAPASFPSNQRAYYSSASVKQEEAAARGAIGVIAFTYPGDPRFRWDVDVARSRRGSFAWLDADGTPRGRGGVSPLRASANLNHNVARALFANATVSLDEVFAAAAASTPQAFELPVEVSIGTASRHRTVDSHNIVAKLEGTDANLRNEHVVYVAHVDHFGIGDAVEGDSIYNGAHDNASGTAILLEIARAFTSLPQPPRRSILFLVVTAEEWGLLGSDYFVHNPTVPRSSLVANMSLDMPFLYHPLLDVVPYGAEHSTLSDAISAAATHMDIAIGPDPIPEQVLFIRSDHFSFVRQGIPALFIKSGFETGDERDGGAINTAFRRDRYHTPFDEIDQGFDFAAGVSHARVNFLTGYYVAMRDERPSWNPGDFFGGLFGGAS